MRTALYLIGQFIIILFQATITLVVIIVLFIPALLYKWDDLPPELGENVFY